MTRSFASRLAECPAVLQDAYRSLCSSMPLDATAKDTANGEGRTFKVSGARVLRIDPKPVAGRLGVWLPVPESVVLQALAGPMAKGLVARRPVMSSEAATWVDVMSWNAQLDAAFAKLIRDAGDAAPKSSGQAGETPPVASPPVQHPAAARQQLRPMADAGAPPPKTGTTYPSPRIDEAEAPETHAFSKYLERRVGSGELAADADPDECYCPSCKSHHAVRWFVDRENDHRFFVCNSGQRTAIVVARTSSGMKVLSLHDFMTEFPALKGAKPSWLRRLASAAHVEVTLMPPFVSVSFGKWRR